MSIERAPEPTEIIWENVGYNIISKLIRKSITFILFFIVILVCFLLIMGLTQDKFNKPQKELHFEDI